MGNTTTKRFSKIIVTILLGVILISGWLIADKGWQWGKWLIDSFYQFNGLFFLGLAGLSSLIRLTVFKEKPLFYTSLYILFAGYLVIFQTKLILPSGTQPTFYMIWPFLIGGLLFVLFMGDAVINGINALLKNKSERYGIWAKFTGLLILTGLLFKLVDKPYFASISEAVLIAYYILIIILPWLSGLARKYYLGKPMKYLKGLLIYFVSSMMLAWIVRYFHGDHVWVWITLYGAAWAHLYYEHILDWLFKNDRLETLVITKPKINKSAKRTAKRKPGRLKLLRDAREFFKVVKSDTVTKWRTMALSAKRQFGRNKVAKIVVVVVLVTAVIFGLGLPLYNMLHGKYYLKVENFTPEGKVGKRTVIRIAFNGKVRPENGHLENIKCFTIKPAIAGIYRQENDWTISFVPNQPLKPSTNYTAIFSPEGLEGVNKKLSVRAETSFYTEPFKVTQSSLFYRVDQITGKQMEIMGQLDFNYPVNIDDLRRNTTIAVGGQSRPAGIEKSIIPTRYYFKGLPVKPSKKIQEVELTLNKELKCIGGTNPLGTDYQRYMRLPKKPNLEVHELKLWHEPGTTFVSLMFNMPISKKQVKDYVTISPAIPWDVETEYACAVLKADYQPNKKYVINVGKGMVSKSGEVLEKEYKKEIYIKDLPPEVKFARKGNILTLSGPKTLAVKTTNLDRARVEIRKVFKNNLIDFMNDPQTTRRTHFVFGGDINVKEGKLNEAVTQYINLSNYQKEPYKGLFQIRLMDPEHYYAGDSTWVLCSDIGLVAKRSGKDLWVYALSYKILEPLAETGISLISTSNQVMEKQKTDEQGRAIFKNWKKHDYDLRPFYILAEKNGDFSFMNFSWTQLNQFQYSIGGDSQAREGVEGFLTTERGVCRPGEKAFITGIVRNANNTVPFTRRYKWKMFDPRGNIYKIWNKSCDENGVMTTDVSFSPDALTGQYRIRLILGEKVVGSTNLKLEEFIPDKLRVNVKTGKRSFGVSDPFSFAVTARQMFGAPAVGNKVQTHVRFYSRIFTAKAYPGYTFSDGGRSFQDEEMDLGQEKLNNKGEYAYVLEIPRITPPSALKAYIYSEVFDSGGRPVSGSGYADIDVYPYYLGIKVLGKAPHLVDQPVNIDFAALAPAGKPVKAKDVRLVVKRKGWYSIFHHGAWGRSQYQSSSYEEIITNKKISIDKARHYHFNPSREGEYKIMLVSPEGMQSSLSVRVIGPGYETASLEAPEKLILTLDQKKYKIGDQAKVFVKAPFPGKLILSLEREKVYETRSIDMAATDQVITLPVKEEYLPNMYVVALVVRKPDEKYGTLPMLSFGIQTLAVDKTVKSIPVTLSSPKAVKSNEGIDVTLHLPEDKIGSDVILAAVDEGILQITNFQTPDPLNYFYRKRSLDTQTYSTFNLLLPDLWRQKFAIGGGESGDITRRHLNPVAAKKKKSLARFSGILKPDDRGNVTYHFKTNDFDGAVRIMAMAVQGDHYGSNSSRVRVADPIVVHLNTPRFAAPRDHFQVPIELFNRTGRKGKFVVRMTVAGPAKINGNKSISFNLEKEGRKRVAFFIDAKADAGVAAFRVTASGAGEKTVKKTEVSIRPIHPLETVVKQGKLAPGKSAALDVPAGFIPYGQKCRINASSNPLFQYLASLEYLLQYPYGCAEQITSKIFPLLYLKDLGLATGRFTGKGQSMDYYIQEGIAGLEKLQLPDGEFTMWPGGRPAGRWLTCYISHFLLEADRKGYQINKEVLAKTRNFITKANHQPQVKPGRLDRRKQGQENASVIDPYILYLKTLIKKPDKESMAHLFYQRFDKLTEVDRAILSMSYAELGDKGKAAKLLKPDFKSTLFYREQFGSFNSSVRNTAMYLAALAEVTPDSSKIPAIIDYLVKQMNNGHFGTTQEDAWAMMALGRVYGSKAGPVQLDLMLDQHLYKTLSGQNPALSDNGLSGKKISIINRGGQPAYYYLMAEGTPLERKKKVISKGMTVRKYYRDSKGNAVNLGNMIQGELTVVTLEIKADKEDLRNIVVVDLLPAGFEIENPRLKSRGQLGFVPPCNMTIDYQDIRDDRILIFSNRIAGTASFSYAVRAVTPGTFYIPDTLAEAMYDPEIRGVCRQQQKLVIVDNN